MMKIRTGVILALAAALAFPLAALPPLAAGADATAAPAAPAHAQYTDAQLDQMVAPIALYPDQLLSQILTASTYPLEIVEADRWVKQPDNAALAGDDLAQALTAEPWDPSVKSLVPFPQVLHMMDDNLSWTEQLGDAFLSDQKRVMDAVQRLRRQAQAAGNLDSSQYQTVKTVDSQIVIVPAAPDVVYVPVYNPLYVYGAWPYPAYPPYYFNGYFSVGIVGAFGWFGFSIVQPLWGWGDWDWRRGYMTINPVRFNDINVGRPRVDVDRWHHNPYHRHGVPYPNRQMRERYERRGMNDGGRFRGYPAAQPPFTPSTVAPRVFSPGPAARGGVPQGGGAPEQRGGTPQQRQQRQQREQREQRQQQQQFERQHEFETRQRESGRRFEQQRFQAPRAEPRPSPAFESFGRSAGDIRMQSQRGFSSRRSMEGGGFLQQRGFGGVRGGEGGGGGGSRGRERERR